LIEVISCSISKKRVYLHRFFGNREESMPDETLNKYIESTNLKASCRRQDVVGLCEEALMHSFYAVCIPPYFVEAAKQVLQKSNVKIVTVVGFPMGYQLIQIKVDECKRYMDHGADEIDAVVNISAIKSGDWEYVRHEIESLTTLVQLKDKKIKIIIETALLTQDEIIQVCQICKESKVDFVKTSTGYTDRGASVDDVLTIKSVVENVCKIKAAGSIKDAAMANALIAAGAHRIGTSNALSMISR
jgi:deoxyribose-phosphate aldolase